jgi:hypothetical protein
LSNRSSMPIFWLALSVPSHRWACAAGCTGLGWLFSRTLQIFGNCRLKRVKGVPFEDCACNVRRVWIDCRWLTLSTINRSRIRRDCASLLGWPVAGSPLWRLRSLSLWTRRS